MDISDTIVIPMEECHTDILEDLQDLQDLQDQLGLLMLMILLQILEDLVQVEMEEDPVLVEDEDKDQISAVQNMEDVKETIDVEMKEAQVVHHDDLCWKSLSNNLSLNFLIFNSYISYQFIWKISHMMLRNKLSIKEII